MLVTDFAITRPSGFAPRLTVSNRELPFRETWRASFEDLTGISRRPISRISEQAMAVHAVNALLRDQRLDKKDCCGLVIASSSLAPPIGDMLEAAQENTEDRRAVSENWGSISSVTRCVDRFLGQRLAAERVVGINWGCSGFPKAVARGLELARDLPASSTQYVMVVTTNRLSRHMDWAGPHAAIFGDSATACAIVPAGRMAGTKRILHVHAKTVPVSGINFTCGRSAITRPSFANGEIVFSQTDEPIGGVLAMNSRVIGPNAPRLLHEAVKEAVAALGLNESARAQWHFVPHQAGKGPIANFIAQAGIDPNKVTQAYHNVGNLTSSAIPFALSQVWDTIAELEIACPSVGAGAVGTPTMTSGMVVLGC